MSAGSDSLGWNCLRASDPTTQPHLFGNQSLGNLRRRFVRTRFFSWRRSRSRSCLWAPCCWSTRTVVARRPRLRDRLQLSRPRKIRRDRAAPAHAHLRSPRYASPQSRAVQLHVPLQAFLAGTCAVEMGFPPGRGVRYQSMGFALLGEIIRCVTGQSCSDFLRIESSKPLWMNDTSLGALRNGSAAPTRRHRGSPRSGAGRPRAIRPPTGAGTAITGGDWCTAWAASSRRRATWPVSPA